MDSSAAAYERNRLPRAALEHQRRCLVVRHVAEVGVDRMRKSRLAQRPLQVASRAQQRTPLQLQLGRARAHLPRSAERRLVVQPIEVAHQAARAQAGRRAAQQRGGREVPCARRGGCTRQSCLGWGAPGEQGVREEAGGADGRRVEQPFSDVSADREEDV